MRRRDREITDKNQIEEILSSCKYLHLGLSDNNIPYVIPMNYGFVKDSEHEQYILYLHCAHEGKKLDIIKKNPKCCFTLERNVAPFEGKVACQYGMVYESIIGYGDLHIIEDPTEKMAALNALMHTQTGMDHFQFDERLVSIVTVLRLNVSELTAKKRPLPGSGES